MDEDNVFLDHDLSGRRRPQTGISARRMMQNQIEQISSELEGVMRTTQPLISQQQRLKEQLALLDLGENAENVPPETLDRLVIFQKEAHQVLTEFSTTSPVRRNRSALDSSPISKARLNATPKTALSTRKMRPINTSPRHHEIDLATELGEGLVEEVRRLQAQLYEKDEALKQQIKLSQAEDRNADDLEVKIKSALANEDKLKSFNWELESRARDAEEANRNLIETTSRLEKDLQIAISVRDTTFDQLEMARVAQEESRRELVDLRVTMSESLMFEKEIQADLRGELATLQSSLDQAQADLQAQKTSAPETIPQSDKSAVDTNELNDEDILETPPSSPPQSPIKGTPHRNATLESETMKGTLFYNQAKMLRQRKDLEREKTQRMQLQRQLKDLEEEIDELKQQLGSQLPRRRINKSLEVASKRKIHAREFIDGRRPTSEISFVDDNLDEQFWEDDNRQEGSLFETALAHRKGVSGAQKELNDGSDSDTNETVRSEHIASREWPRSRSTTSINTIESSVSLFTSSPIQERSKLQDGTLASASSADSRYTSGPRDLRDELNGLAALESPSVSRNVSDDLDGYTRLLTQPITREIGTMTDEPWRNIEAVSTTVSAIEDENRSWTFVQEDPSLYPQSATRQTAKLTFIHETRETIAQENGMLNTTTNDSPTRVSSAARHSEIDAIPSIFKATVVRVGGRGPFEEPTNPYISYESLHTKSDEEVTIPLASDGHESTNRLGQHTLPSSEDGSGRRDQDISVPLPMKTTSGERIENSSQPTTVQAASFSEQNNATVHADSGPFQEKNDDKVSISPFTKTSQQMNKNGKSRSQESAVHGSQEETVIISKRRISELTKAEEQLVSSQHKIHQLLREETQLLELVKTSKATLLANKNSPESVQDLSEHKSELRVVEGLAIARPISYHGSKSEAYDPDVADTDTEDASLASPYRLSHLKDLRSSNSSPTAKAEKVLGKSPSLREMSTSKSISRSLRSQRSNESMRDRPGMAPPIAPSNARDTLRSRQIKIIDHRPSSSKLASRTDLPAMDAVYGTARVMPTRSYSERSISSLSSFASEIDEHLNPRFDYESPQTMPRATDPATIESITRTMIGMSMYKYTRRTGRQGLSDKRHRRYFWIHPYTKTLYWSVYNPVNAPEGAIIKSAPILTVHVESDHNNMPPGLHQRSICIDTPRRMLKLTAVHSTDHEDWVRSLNFLINGPPAADQAPEARQETDAIIRDFSPTRSPEPSHGSSSRVAPAFDSQRTVRARSPSRSLSGRVNAFFRPPSSQSKGSRRTASPAKQSLSTSRSNMSIHQAELTLDNISDGLGLENVRECCGGRHDVATLCHRTGGSSRASSRSGRR